METYFTTIKRKNLPTSLLSHPIREQITHHGNQVPCRHHSVLRLHLMMWSCKQVEGSPAAGILTKPRLREGGWHHFGSGLMVLLMMMMMVVEVVVGVWLGKVVHIVLLWRWRETTGVARREETELVITRRRF